MTTSIQEEIKTDLMSVALDRCVTKWVFDRRPFVFDAADADAYWAWTAALADRLEVDPRDVVVTGSAAVGVSLNPRKSLKPFDSTSDIDVAVISAHHFEVAWRALRSLGTERYKLTAPQRLAVDDHRERLIYWGAVATDRILPMLPFGRPWQEALSEMRFIDPLTGHELNARVYRDVAALRSYIRSSMREVRDSLLGAP